MQCNGLAKRTRKPIAPEHIPGVLLLAHAATYPMCANISKPGYMVNLAPIRQHIASRIGHTPIPSLAETSTPRARPRCTAHLTNGHMPHTRASAPSGEHTSKDRRATSESPEQQPDNLSQISYAHRRPGLDTVKTECVHTCRAGLYTSNG